MRTIHPYASYCSISGVFSHGGLPHSVGGARHACVCFVAQLHSAKARYSALSAVLRSGRELMNGLSLDEITDLLSGD